MLLAAWDHPPGIVVATGRAQARLGGTIVVRDRAGVAGRLDFLRRTDPGLMRFGSAAHSYLLNPPLTESEIAAFEARHGLSLPGDYRSFVLEVGEPVPPGLRA